MQRGYFCTAVSPELGLCVNCTGVGNCDWSQPPPSASINDGAKSLP